MAEEDEASTEAVPEPQPSGGLMNKLLLGGGAVGLLVVGIFAGPAVKNMISSPPEEETETAPETVDREGPELFTSLHPPLVVNFTDTAGGSHFMQITMEVMARDQEIIDAVKNHIPVIRNSLILLYGNANYDVITTRSGKEQMLADGLAEIQRIMKERIGEDGVEAVYFTNLVIQ